MTLTVRNKNEDTRKAMIRETVAAFEKRFSDGLPKHDAERKKLTKTRANVFGADKEGKDVILALHIPAPLYRALCNVVERPFAEQEELRWFMRKFPRYTVPEKI